MGPYSPPSEGNQQGTELSQLRPFILHLGQGKELREEFCWLPGLRSKHLTEVHYMCNIYAKVVLFVLKCIQEITILTFLLHWFTQQPVCEASRSAHSYRLWRFLLNIPSLFLQKLYTLSTPQCFGLTAVNTNPECWKSRIHSCTSIIRTAVKAIRTTKRVNPAHLKMCKMWQDSDKFKKIENNTEVEQGSQAHRDASQETC